MATTVRLAELLPPPVSPEASCTVTMLAGKKRVRRRRDAQGKRLKGTARKTYVGPLPPPMSKDNPWHMAADQSWRSLGLWALDTINANIWGTALKYLEVSSADICVIQEHRLHGDDTIDRASTEAKRKGWACKPQQALRTGTAHAATSSGTAIAAKRGFG